MKRLLAISIFAFTLILLAACGSGGSEETNGNSGNDGSGDKSKLTELQEAGSVTVGFANEKPYGYQDDNGKLKGAAVDIAQAVFADLGIDTVNGKVSEFGELVAGLNAGKFDVITAGMAINPDRCKNVDFGEPEMVYGEGLIVPKGNPKDLHSYADIAETGASVSIMSGATEIEYVKTEGVKKDQIKEASDIAATFAAVESGRADATTGTEMTVKMALKSAGNDKLEFVNDFEQPDIEGVPSYGAAAFHPDNDELREAYNESLQKLIDDGTVAEMLEKNGFDPKYNAPPEDIKTEEICSGEKY
ncbi:ectoine/hydroxyectoine ABC transporter substrate-binding protein EhuB [Lentibacillus cibarius]|uniref:Ectoine/hydroxyectoine ABC transporter substrate-binding protein EhuB n=1 Tax=Lentibacillus cibarius TaxID=2583219 RepID=A0A549YHH9_9BACI|nr:ectoine/hydroxyectoine ABC transporter substrate-binding protein EhuB [Lentibacillus cibarius]TMN22527.1 ectoine/hydroxyectoine ABC transporter substrate-binding protein EhuB [Lentibacillus cibarius]TRM11324.1 ectoine/hydroxyectoine ABC transporter substrate-binding protein EhuB [Lentibacillus cibarius]